MGSVRLAGALGAGAAGSGGAGSTRLEAESAAGGSTALEAEGAASTTVSRFGSVTVAVGASVEETITVVEAGFAELPGGGNGGAPARPPLADGRDAAATAFSPAAGDGSAGVRNTRKRTMLPITSAAPKTASPMTRGGVDAPDAFVLETGSTVAAWAWWSRGSDERASGTVP